HSRQIAGGRDVRDFAHGGQKKRRGAAGGARLHAGSLRRAVRAGTDSERCRRGRAAQSPALRPLLRPRRRVVQRGLMSAERDRLTIPYLLLTYEGLVIHL